MSTLWVAAAATALIAAVVAVVVTQRAEPETSGRAQTAIAERVIDGDTFTARTPGGQDLGRIRVLGINAPEMARDGDPEMCHAQEATDAAKELLEGHTVQVSTDPTQDQRDRYDRLLAYVDVEGTDFARAMLDDGHVRLYKGSSLDRQDAYDDAASSARDNAAGLWAKC